MSGPALRAAILGCGGFAVEARGMPHGLGARSHVEGYQACAHTTLVAGYDPDPAARARFSEIAAAPAFDDLEALFGATAPDIVTIASPDATHVELLEHALAHGARGVLMEKPLAPTLTDAVRAVRAAERANAVVAMNFSRRYAPVLRETADRIKSGALGDLQAMRGTYTNGLSRNGSHLVDLVRWWGGEMRSVLAQAASDGLEGDPTLDVECRLDDGCRVALTGLDGRAFDHFELDVIGTRGRIRLVRFGHTVELYEAKPSARHPGYREEALVQMHENVLFDMTRHAVDALVESVLGAAPPLASLADGVAAVAVVEAARRSLRTGNYEAVRAE